MKRYSAIRWALLFIPVVMLAGTVVSVLTYSPARGNFNFLCAPAAIAGVGWDNGFDWRALPFIAAAFLISGFYLLCWLRDWRKTTLVLFIADAVISIGMAAASLSRANPFIPVFWIPVIFHAIGFVLLGVSMKKK